MKEGLALSPQTQRVLGHMLSSRAYLITSVLTQCSLGHRTASRHSAKFPLGLLLEVIHYITSWGRRGAAELVRIYWLVVFGKQVYSATLRWGIPLETSILYRTREDRFQPSPSPA